MKLKPALTLFALFASVAHTAQASTVSGTLPGSTYTYFCQFSTETVTATMSAPGAAFIKVTAGTGNEAQSETSTDGYADATASGFGNTSQTCTYYYDNTSYTATVTNN